MRPCFTFTAQAGGRPAILSLDEEIGFWGTQAKDFRASLDSVAGDDLVVEINSPGGDVMAGLGMYNMLRNWAAAGKRVTTRVTGVAASIASVVALAGDKREMPKNSFAMVHQVSTVMLGGYTADELREAAELNDKISAQLRTIYESRMGVSEDKAAEIMSKETWLTADECLDLGFATDLTDEVQATAKFDVAKAELPAHVAKVFAARGSVPSASESKDPLPATTPAAESAAESAAQDIASAPQSTPVVEAESELLGVPLAQQIEALANKAGLPMFAAHLAVSCSSLTAARSRIAAAREISALCNLAGRPEDAPGHILADRPVPEVRTSLIQAMADGDKMTNTAHAARTPSAGVSGGAISPREIYAKRAARKQNSSTKGT